MLNATIPMVQHFKLSNWNFWFCLPVDDNANVLHSTNGCYSIYRRKKESTFLFRFGCQQNFHRKYHEYIHIYFGRIHSSRENVIFNLLKDFDIPFISVNQWISFRIERNSFRFSFVCIHNGKQQYSNNNINHFRKTFRQMNASSGWVSISLILI